MQYQRRLNLRRTQPMPRHIDHIVHPALNPNIPVLVAARAVAGVEHARVGLHVRLEVSLVVLVDRTRNRWPWRLDDEHALDVIPMQLLKRENRTRITTKNQHQRDKFRARRREEKKSKD